ncbi:MAG TPA: hypothetical protein VHP30_04055 [Ignavibacteriales bacterium]|nr:hypothetical protein [Ignavibacteriales bacterium]
MKIVFFLIICMLTVAQGQTVNNIIKPGENRFSKPELLPGKEREPELEKLKPAKITEEGFYVPVSAKIYFKGDVGITEYKDTIIYNEKGERISREQSIWKNNTWMEYGKEYYEFDSKGRVSALTSANMTDSGWVGGKRVYTYDENDNLSRLDIFSGLLADLKPESRSIYERDSNGYTNEYIVMDWDPKAGGGWVNYYKYVYEIDAAGHTLSSINYDWNDTGWVKYYILSYSYNSQFWQTSALLEYFKIDGSPNGAWKTEYSYYPNGDLKSSASSIKTGADWKNYGRSEYTYTGAGKVQTYIYQQGSHSSWQSYVD